MREALLRADKYLAATEHNAEGTVSLPTGTREGRQDGGQNGWAVHRKRYEDKDARGSEWEGRYTGVQTEERRQKGAWFTVTGSLDNNSANIRSRGREGERERESIKEQLLSYLIVKPV